MPQAKILIIEDNEIVVMDLQAKLKEFNYSVIGVFHSGEEAVIKYPELFPDCILMDVMIAGNMDGIDTATKLMEIRKIPVIFTTSFPDSRVIKRIVESTPYCYLSKPFTSSELHINIELAMSNHQKTASMAKRVSFDDELLKVIPDSLVVLDTTGAIQYIDPRLYDFCKHESQELQGLNFIQALPKEGKSGAIADFQSLLKGHKTSRNFKLTNSQDKTFEFCITGIPIIKDDVVTGILFMFHEKQSFVDNSNSSLFQLAVEQCPVSIVITDNKGTIEFANEYFHTLTGYGAKEVVGENPRILKSGYQSEDFYKEMWQTISTGQIWSGELLNKKKDGELYWEHATISPLKDDTGKIDKFIGIKENITQKKTTEELLIRHIYYEQKISEFSQYFIENREVEAVLYKSLGLLLEASNVTRICIYENIYEGKKYRNSKLFSVNSSIDDELLLKKNEGKIIDLDSIPGWLQKLGSHQIVDIRVSDEINDSGLFLSRDVVGLLLLPIFIYDTFWGVLEFDDCRNKRDISDEELRLLKLATNILGNYFQKLVMENEREIALRNAEIAEHKALNVAKLKSLYFTAMSHEIKTPLNSIYGIIELLQETNLNDEQREFVKIQKETTSHILEVINQILDYSRLEVNELTLEKIVINLNEMIQMVTNSFKDKAQKKGVIVNYSVGENVPGSIVSDPVKLKQVLINLIGNAVKFTDQGEVKLTVSSEPVNSCLERITFEVSDTGPGIAEDRLSQIFEAYQQGDLSITRRFGGTGLGLAITRKIVDLFKGKISVESKLNEGSLFKVVLDLEKNISDDVRANKHDDYAVDDFKNLRVLIVDDNEVSGKVTSLMLKKIGCQVDVIADGHLVIENLLKNKYNIIFMDIELGDICGCDISREIRSSVSRDIPIVALTAHNANDIHDKCLEAGISEILMKPVVISSILDVVAKYLKK